MVINVTILNRTKIGFTFLSLSFYFSQHELEFLINILITNGVSSQLPVGVL